MTSSLSVPSEGGPHPDISVVIPVYGCEKTIVPLYQRLGAVLSDLVASYEIVFVDDRAVDNAWRVLRQVAESDPGVVAIRLARNVGQHLAITAGLEHCHGRHAVLMDCDLQDPPETIPALYARALDGVDIVLGKRKNEPGSPVRLLCNRLYFAALGLITGEKFDGELGTFSVISRRVVEAFLQFSERERHYLMVLNAIGFDRETVEYQRDTRAVGKSSYTIRKLISHALSGLFFTTTRLLHWVIYAGLGLSVLGIVLAAALVISWFRYGALAGWTSLAVLQLLVGGVMTLCVGVTGLYVGKILEETQRRPLYFVDECLDSRRAAADRRVRTLYRANQP